MKEVALRAIRPNAGIEAAYRKKLDEWLVRMTADILRRLKRAYPAAAEALAMDDKDAVVELRKAVSRWGREWEDGLDDMASEIAEMFAGRAKRSMDIVFRRRMKEAGFTVRFRPTKRMVSAYRVVVAENVNLIKSIPQQFLKDVQTAVWQNVMKGGDLYALSTQLRQKHGVSRRRAAFISRDQNSKARAVFQSVRDQELGVSEAIWRHSHAGKVPRPTHLAFNGKKFKLKDGMYDSDAGENVMPGQLPNCRCSYSPIIQGFEP